MKEGPDRRQDGEVTGSQPRAEEKKAETAIRELVLVSAGCAIVAFVLGATTMDHYELGLPFAAAGLAAGILAMKKAGWKRVESGPAFLAANAVLLVIGLLSFYGQNFADMRLACRNNCTSHIAMLGRCFSEYAAENDGQYPAPEEWCDRFLKERRVGEAIFVCKGAQTAGSEALCHYAMNPNARPDSAGDVVLLFETKGGLNQCGGQELMTFDNHEGKGCNILFVEGRAEFWKATNDPNKLNWGKR